MEPAEASFHTPGSAAVNSQVNNLGDLAGFQEQMEAMTRTISAVSIAMQELQNKFILVSSKKRAESPRQENVSPVPQAGGGPSSPDPYASIHTPFAFGPPIDPRRYSMFNEGLPAVQAPIGSPVKQGVREKTNQVNLVHTEKEIAEADKMKVLSVHAIRTFKRKLDLVNATRPLPLKIQTYISAEVLIALWNFMSRKEGFGFTWGRTFEAIFDISHEQFLLVVAMKLRPKSYTEYKDTLNSCLPKFRLPKGFTIASDDYDIHMFPQMAEFWLTVIEVDEFTRRGATSAELALIPPSEWAHGRGAIAVSFALLGQPIADQFKERVGEQKLKDCKSMEALYKLVTETNQTLANQSENRRIQRQSNEPKEKYESIASSVNRVVREDGQRGITPRGTGTQQQSSTTQRKPFNPQHQRNAFYMDDTFESVENEVPIGDLPAVPAESDTKLYDVYPDLDETGEVFAIKTYPAKEKERTLPCYDHFEGKCALGDTCVYSHDAQVQKLYGQERLKILIRSPYITMQDLYQAAKEKNSTVDPVRGPIQPVRLLKPNPQDARALPAGRGPAHHLRVLSNPDMPAVVGESGGGAVAGATHSS